MPGHVKTGGSKEADPDPSEFLIVSFEMKKEDSLKPYDPKKSVWVPDGEGGFDEALIQEVKGNFNSFVYPWTFIFIDIADILFQCCLSKVCYRINRTI